MQLPNLPDISDACFASPSASLLAAAAPMTLHAQRGPGTRAMLPGMDGPILLDTMGLAVPISGNRDSIFAALTTVFNELKIPVQLNDPKQGLLNNLNADVSRRLGGQPMSRYIDCGRSFSGENADVYRITLAVSAWLEPNVGEPKTPDGRHRRERTRSRGTQERVFGVHVAGGAGEAHRRPGAGDRGEEMRDDRRREDEK